MTPSCDKETKRSWLKHRKMIARRIALGSASQIEASNLLADIENGEVSIGQLPVSLQAIENVAGRKLHELIVD